MSIARDDLKARVIAEVGAHRRELIDLSLRIHSHPETAFEERRASSWLCEYLEGQGFVVERGYCGLETAFRARAGSERPLVAFLAEYDALPGLGHACGHNIIATSSVGAALASKAVLEATGGGVAVIGTPAEESVGGKGLLAERGAFADLDAAMLAHPGSRDMVVARLLAVAGLTVEYFGRPAHAASRPDSGLNALDALVTAYNAISALRQHIRDSARIHGIITDGGQAPNVVPGHSAGSFLVRAEDDAYLEELKARVIACFEAGALATGCRLEHRWSPVQYSAMRTNGPLAEAYRSNITTLGRTIPEDAPARASGSSDMGNVSILVPAIHPTIAIAPPEVGIHSAEFAVCAASEDAHRGLVDAAKALAMTAVDVLVDEELRERMRGTFLSGSQPP